VSPAVAGGDKSSTGTQMDKSSTGTQMDKSSTGTQMDKSGTSTQMNKSGTSEQGVSGQGMSASSSKVRRAQEALKSEGHDPGPIDGVMGPRTQQALRQYQREENLKETGRLDQDTMSKLGV
jgi:peptidoglycan hydrolase-like protein with peptidoglycan-binding domain